MANTNDIYEPDIDEVIKSEQSEKGYIASRREKIADEFKKIFPDEKQHWYADILSQKDRPLVGMAFSGGGIRSATFNLGLAQALSKFGILPWVDYLSSVSGGGYIASCMNSLLAYEEKKLDLNEKDSNPKRYYPFSPHWKRFPFNPDLQVFDTTGVAYKLPLFNENTLRPQLETKDRKSAKIFSALQTGLADEINLDLKEVDDKIATVNWNICATLGIISSRAWDRSRSTQCAAW